MCVYAFFPLFGFQHECHHHFLIDIKNIARAFTYFQRTGHVLHTQREFSSSARIAFHRTRPSGLNGRSEHCNYYAIVLFVVNCCCFCSCCCFCDIPNERPVSRAEIKQSIRVQSIKWIKVGSFVYTFTSVAASERRKMVKKSLKIINGKQSVLLSTYNLCLFRDLMQSVEIK